MEKTIYYIHPATKRGMVFVTRERKNGRKTVLVDEFCINIPGTWDEDKWNLHIDGCNYLHNTLDDAIKHGADMLNYNPLSPNDKPGYELRKVNVPFDWQHEDLECYNIKNATPYTLRN